MKCVLLSTLAVALGASYVVGSSCPDVSSKEHIALVQRQVSRHTGEATELSHVGNQTDHDKDSGHITELVGADDFASTKASTSGCVGGLSYSSAGWENGLDGVLNFNCPTGVISRLYSQHDNGAEDRRWTFSCSSVCTQMSGGVSSGYLNNMDATVHYTCPSNSAVTGLYSYHDNGAEDRRWAVHCSNVLDGTISLGGWTDWINNWDGQMDYSCPSGQALTGVYSEHDNGREDRHWKVRCGTFIKNTPSPTLSPTHSPTSSPTASPTEPCPSGFDFSSRDLTGAGQVKSSSSTDLATCASACASRGCTGFEYGTTGVYAGCWTYTGGSSNVKTTAQYSGWTSCVKQAQPAAASASGDPHLSNTRGDKFDIYKTGAMDYDSVVVGHTA